MKPLRINTGGFIMENKNEFDYVFKACAGKIRPAAINDLLSVPEFVEELRNFDGEVDNKVVYELSEKVLSRCWVKETRYKDFRQTMISEKGAEAWKEWDNKYRLLLNGYRKAKISVLGRDATKDSEFEYVWNICDGKIHPEVTLNLLSVPEFTEELRKSNGEANIQTLYEIVKKLRNEYNSRMSNDEFKKKFISEQGEDSWRRLRYKYNLIAEGFRNLNKNIT